MENPLNTLWLPLTLMLILTAACVPVQTPEPTMTSGPTATAPPQGTEHQTVMPPTLTETAVLPQGSPTPDATSKNIEPTIGVEPLDPAVGGEVVIIGSNFPPEAEVQMGIGRVNSEYDLVETAQTDAEGNLDAVFRIPDFVEPEDRWVIVVTAEQSRVKVFSEELEIKG